MLAIRSLLLIVFGLVAGTLYAAATILLFWTPRKFLFGFVTSFCRLMLWAGEFFCGLKMVIEGRENLPDTPSVIMIKHSSLFETYGHVPVFPRSTWVLKREIFWVPVFGWALALVFKPIAIDRSTRGRAVKQVIEQGRARLAEGIWVTIFPEGTRMPPGETRRYGISGAALAKGAGVMIVPVAHNAGDFWARHQFRKYPGTVRFCIGPPIDPAGRPPKDTNLIVQDWIESKMREISTVYQDAD